MPTARRVNKPITRTDTVAPRQKPTSNAAKPNLGGPSVQRGNMAVSSMGVIGGGKKAASPKTQDYGRTWGAPKKTKQPTSVGRARNGAKPTL